MEAAAVKVALPTHLRRLAGLSGSVVTLHIRSGGAGPVALADVLDALENAYPMLRGTTRDAPTASSPQGTPRPFMRFFAGTEDLTQRGLAVMLPEDVLSGREVLRIVGANCGRMRPAARAGSCLKNVPTLIAQDRF